MFCHFPLWKFQTRLRFNFAPALAEEIRFIEKLSNLTHISINQMTNLRQKKQAWRPYELLKCIAEKGRTLVSLEFVALPKPVRQMTICHSYDSQILLISKLPKLIHLKIDLNFNQSHYSRWKAISHNFGLKQKFLYQIKQMKLFLGRRFRREILWDLLMEFQFRPSYAFLIDAEPNEKQILSEY